jgi:hypothetical protein
MSVKGEQNRTEQRRSEGRSKVEKRKEDETIL